MCCQSSLRSTHSPDVKIVNITITELRNLLKDTLVDSGMERVVLDGGTIQLVTSTRTCLDGKALQREAPELYRRFQHTSRSSYLRVTFKEITDD